MNAKEVERLTRAVCFLADLRSTLVEVSRWIGPFDIGDAPRCVDELRRLLWCGEWGDIAKTAGRARVSARFAKSRSRTTSRRSRQPTRLLSTPTRRTGTGARGRLR
jgi:hypothetical protein